MRQNLHQDTTITKDRLLVVHQQLPHLVRGSAAHFKLIRELAADSTGVPLLLALSPDRNPNDFAPAISTLPEDILEIIFSCLADIWPPRGPMLFADSGMMQYNTEVLSGTEKREKDVTGRALPSFGAGDSTLGWICLIHICSAWRQLVFRIPSLWARHLGTLPGAAFEGMLYWSGETRPISITTLSSSMRPGAEEEVAAALRSDSRLAHRIEHIRFERTMRETRKTCPFGRILGQRQTPSFPCLRTLDVSANVLYRSDLNYCSLPLVEAPNLARLRMEDYFLRWNSSALVDLDISGTVREMQVPVLVILDLIRVNAKTLRSLRLYDCIESNDTARLAETLADAPHVFLPGLEDFALGSSARAVAYLLTGAFMLPSNVPCTLTSTRPNDTVVPIIGLFSVAWTLFLDTGKDISIRISDRQRGVTSARYNDRDDCIVEFFESADTNPGALDEDSWCSEAGPRPGLSIQLDADDGFEYLASLLDSNSHDFRITALSLQIDSGKETPEEAEIEDLMDSLRHVRFLHMNNFRFTGGCPADLDSVSLLCESPDNLPSLETLSVIYDSTWRLSWQAFSRHLARRPRIRTLIIHDRFSLPVEEKEDDHRQVLQIIGRQGLEVLWLY
ncbi:unnamed protein product [Peniophora sp. CBMAI 1063]|nr:unnamed protein product [Peniophora sp. CBMAI 1063]